MRISQPSSRARLLAGATAAALGLSVLAAGQALAAVPQRAAARQGGIARPAPAARGASAVRPGGTGRLASASTGAAGRRRPIRVGSVTIPPCPVSRLAWCTRINVPLDYRNPAAGHIKLGFQWYPATGGHPIGTILAVQGGPGFPTTDYAPDYRGTFLPLLARRNLLLVNLRGTGNSSAFLCKTLQDWKAADGIAAYTADTGKCGRQLNHTRKLPGGGYVQASDLYTTANAARDVALLLRRLQTGKVDLYGDSYGTFFGQTFTARYAKTAPLGDTGLGLSSQPDESVLPAHDSDGKARLQYLLRPQRRLPLGRAGPVRGRGSVPWPGTCAAHPVTGRTRTPFGRRVTERVTVDKLSEMVNDAGSDSGVYRELDPAAPGAAARPRPGAAAAADRAGHLHRDLRPGAASSTTASTRRPRAWTTRSRSATARRRPSAPRRTRGRWPRCRPARSPRSPSMSG